MRQGFCRLPIRRVVSRGLDGHRHRGGRICAAHYADVARQNCPLPLATFGLIGPRKHLPPFPDNGRTDHLIRYIRFWFGAPTSTVSRPPGNPIIGCLTEGVQFYNTILTAVCGDDHVYFSGLTIARPAGRPLPPLVWSRPDLSRVPCEVAGNDLGVSCQRSAGPGLAADVDVSAFFVWLRFVAVAGRFLAGARVGGGGSPLRNVLSNSRYGPTR